VKVRVYANNGVCAADTSNVRVAQVFPVTLINLGPDVSILEGDTVLLSFNTVNGGVWGPTSFINDISFRNPSVWPPETSDYVYTLIDANLCETKDTLKVIVIPKPNFQIMNLISMNNDGKNDRWFIQGLKDFPDTEVYVYNVYGEQVYKNMNYENDWDGKFNGDFLPDGTYYYVVVQGISKEQFKGTLTLLGNE
jgi:gliding motility-associated-like protein